MRALHIPMLLLLLAPPALAQDDMAPLVEAAVEAGIPRALAEEKAREGMAKGIPGARIAVALRHLAGHVADVTPLLPGDADSELVGAAARARREGASPASIRRVGAYSAAVRLKAMNSLGDLLGLGVLESDAVHLLDTASHAPEPNLAITGLATASASLVQAGLGSTAIADTLTDSILSGQSPLSVIPSTAPAGIGAPPIDVPANPGGGN